MLGLMSLRPVFPGLCWSVLCCAVVVPADQLCSFSDPCAFASIGLLMVPVSTVRVVSSQFAEEGICSQQQEYLGFIRPHQVQQLLFDSCPGKSTEH